MAGEWVLGSKPNWLIGVVIGRVESAEGFTGLLAPGSDLVFTMQMGRSTVSLFVHPCLRITVDMGRMIRLVCMKQSRNMTQERWCETSQRTHGSVWSWRRLCVWSTAKQCLVKLDKVETCEFDQWELSSVSESSPSKLLNVKHVLIMLWRSVDRHSRLEILG